MKYLIRRKDIPYIVLTMILGTINHFIYNLSGRKPIVALFTPINESAWEHLKLLFFPFLLFSVVEYYIRRPNPCTFFRARLIGVWVGMLSIIILFYGYSGPLGVNFAFFDIAIYYIAVIIAFFASRKMEKKCAPTETMIAPLLWAATIILFFLMTCFPLNIPLFISP